MLMAQIAESIEEFLDRIVQKVIPRLLEIEGGPPARNDVAYVLASIRMAALLRKAVDDHISSMVVTGRTGSKAGELLDQVLAGERRLLRPTWKEIGEALGVSAQATHRKYGGATREHRDSGRDGQARLRPAGSAWPDPATPELCAVSPRSGDPRVTVKCQSFYLSDLG